VSSKKVIVIGAGVAGLACSIRLRLSGFEVTTLEKNEHPGGKLSDFTLGPYHFDRGPSLFTQPQNVRELFQFAGKNPDDYLSIESLQEANRYFFEDGIIVKAYTNPEAFDEETHLKAGEKRGAVLSYLKKSSATYKKIGTVFLDFPIKHLKTWLRLRIIKSLGAVRYWQLFKTVHSVNHDRFVSKKTVQIFDRFATYNGSNPYQSPGMLTMIPHLEHNEGAFYPRGGMIAITKALFHLAKELGVNFCFNEEAREIVTEGNTVVGVKSATNFYAADAVVSNMDVYFTYQRLLKDSVKAESILKQERSTSAIVFYWGINTTFPNLDLHSIFFSTDYQREFTELFIEKIVPADPTVYVNITSKKDQSHAPNGHENWFVMINAPAVRNIDWNSQLTPTRKRVLEKLSRMLKVDIEKHIVIEQTWLPNEIEQDTASYLGSLYGTSSNDRMAAFLRHANDSNKYNNLYFCGGSVHPGGGIPLCLKSAKLVSELIREQF
jgi:phytoene desaturase